MATEFNWSSIPEHEGSWESFEPWARPLAGVRIEGDALLMEYGNTASSRAPELAHTNFRMLVEFARLCDGDCVADGRLLSFATRYSGLGLCKEHGWPMAHTKPYCPLDRSDTRHASVYREDIKQWRIFSRAARAIVTVLVAPRGDAARDAAKLLIKAGDPDVDHSIIRWLNGGDLKLRFRNRRLTFYGAPPLWTAIGLELAALAAGAKAIVLCSACGRLDSVKRPRRVNDQRRAFCTRCRDKGRTRLTVADFRRRQRQAQELRASGKSVQEIADQLGIGTKRVRHYLAQEAKS